MAGEYKIIGEQRPISGGTYHYELLYNGKVLPTIRWEVRDGVRAIVNKAGGNFTFKTRSVGKSFIVCAYNRAAKDGREVENVTTLRVKVLLGPPAIIKVSWLDKDFKKIDPSKIEQVGYFEDIFLSIQTSNIPPGDFIYVQLYKIKGHGTGFPKNDQTGGLFTMQVNENGVATANVCDKLLQGLDTNTSRADFYIAHILYRGTGRPSPTRIEGKSPELRLKAQSKKIIRAVKSAVVNEDNTKLTKIPVKLKINVYFDGTMGNKWNVDLFEKELKVNVGWDDDTEMKLKEESDGRWTISSKKLSLSEEEQAILEKYGRGSEDTSSYKQALTSIENLYTLDLFKGTKSREFKIYIEGVGSIKHGSDDVVFGAGMALTKGVRSKIARAMAEISSRVNDVINTEKEYVDEVIVCVFGFSRGATTARAFTAMRETLALHTLTAEANVVFKFLGLFDTVSSIMTAAGTSQNVKEFKLDVGNRVKKVVHITAGDEYRKKFPLTNIQSSIDAGVGYEIKLPGEHSDIGGGHKNYHLVKDQYGQEIPVPGIKETLWRNLTIVNKLIEQGWYAKTDIKKIEDVPVDDYHYSGATQFAKFATAERLVWNEYRYIPLGIMIDFATKYGEVKYNKGKQASNYSVKTPLLVSVKKVLHSYALENDGAKSTSAYDEIPEQVKKQLRHEFLHLSAYIEGGKDSMTGVISAKGRYDELQMPDREIIKG